MFQKLKNYTKRFISEESGAELLEIAIGVVIAAGLVGAVILIQNKIGDGMEDAANVVDEGFSNALGGGNNGGGMTP